MGYAGADLCEKFEKQGWCNCHPYFNLRIGISEGRAIAYKDVNGNYNIARDRCEPCGSCYRLLDRNQIAFTSDAHRQIVDMIDDPDFADKFREYQNIRVKHGEIVSLYQYVDPTEDALNNEEPSSLVLSRDAEAMMREMVTFATAGFGSDISAMDAATRIEVAKGLTDLIAKMTSPTPRQVGEGLY